MEILETFFRKDRFHVRVKNRDGIKTMPRATCVWLQGNPSFMMVPSAYVVHHLDYDKTNDDISNLVIMQKFHHAAHHWKNKTVSPKVTVSPSATSLCPTKEPRIYPTRGGKFRVCVVERDDNGERRVLWVSRDDNGSFKTAESAQAFISTIWQNEIPNENSDSGK